MQQFPCPFCGLRDETEFHFVAEAGKTRPDTQGGHVSAAAWSQYLYFQSNPKGSSSEVWMHKTCREYFILERDTLSMAVTGVRALREDEEA